MTNIKKLKLLITGSGGFIGSNFIRRLFHTKQPYSISSLDKVKNLYNIYTNANHDFYIADIRDSHILNVIFQKTNPDIVVHFAAESFVDSSIKDAQSFITSNILGTQNIIDNCLSTKARLVYVSTDEVYGQLEDESRPAWSEGDITNPRNPYSASKLSGELLVKAAHETHGLEYQITRSSNNYGPWQNAEKFIPKIIKHVLNNEEMPVYGRGEQIRDWIHVFDNCEAILRIIERGEINSIYNISANCEFSNIEIFQHICNTIGNGHNLVKFVDDRPGHDFRYAIEASKLRNLGWRPQVKFPEGIKETVQWYINNKFFFNE